MTAGGWMDGGSVMVFELVRVEGAGMVVVLAFD